MLKADGLAAGKGVVIAEDRATADDTVRAAMVDRRFGAAGERIVFEEFLVGEEASYFVLADGTACVSLSSAQDHKRIFDDDRGPNTGGMGAFSPSPRMTADVERRVLDEIVRPVLDGMEREGHPFRGFLYVGLMLTADGPKVVEFNVRFGDPEAQVVMPRLDEDLSWLLGVGGDRRVAVASGAVSRRAARRRRAGRGRLSGCGEDRPGHQRTRQGGERPGRARLSRRDQPARRRARDGRRPGAHGGRSGRRVIARRSTSPTARPRTFGSTACSFAPTSAARRWSEVRVTTLTLYSDPMKYAVVTFGCRVNQADSLVIEDGLRSRGAVPSSPEEADIVVVNTCSVTASADQARDRRSAVLRV